MKRSSMISTALLRAKLGVQICQARGHQEEGGGEAEWMLMEEGGLLLHLRVRVLRVCEKVYGDRII